MQSHGGASIFFNDVLIVDIFGSSEVRQRVNSNLSYMLAR